MAWLGFAISIWLVLFQILLAAGAPLGALAWGGQDKGVLPRNKRLASLASIGLMAIYASAFGQTLELWTLWPDTWLFWIFLIGIGLFALSSLGNLATSSRIERLHGAPVAIGLTLACLALVLR